MAFWGLGPPKAQKDLALAAKLLGDHSAGWLKSTPFTRPCVSLADKLNDPKAADLAADGLQRRLNLCPLLRG